MERHGLTNEQWEKIRPFLPEQNRGRGRRWLDWEFDWEIFFVDGSNVRAHRSASGASKKISPNELKNHDLGYSRGGYSAKIHLVCDGNGNYMNAVLSAGQEYETQHFEAVVTSISVPSHRVPFQTSSTQNLW